MYKIRKYLKDRQDEVNTRNIIIHASSFGILAFGYALERLVSMYYGLIKNTLYNNDGKGIPMLVIVAEIF